MELIDNRYEIRRQLGSGSFGEVYLSFDRRENKDICIKLLRKTSGDRVGQIRDEFRLLSTLDHPNLLRVYDFGIDEKRGQFFTMEFAPGGDLSQIKDVSPAEFSILATAICSALDFIHRRGIIHGDLKPGNILIGSGERYLLSDFGLSFIMAGENMASVSGSAQYMAPELIRKQPPSPSSDIYSLGLIFYELISGRDILGGSPDEIISMKLRGNFSISEIPDEYGGAGMAMILNKMLSSSPAERYKSIGEVLENLARLELGGSAPVPFQRAILGKARFIGRESELEWLKNGIQNWENCSNTTLFIGGEAGAGKSALLDEFRIRSQIDGLKFYRVFCREGDLRPFSPILKILEQIFPELDPELERFSSFGPDLQRLYPDRFPEARSALLSEADIKSGRRRLLDNLLQYLGENCSKSKAILALEDVQWADSDTLELLDLAYRSESAGEGRAIFLICTGQIVAGEPLPSYAQSNPKSARILGNASQADWNSFLESLLRSREISTDFSSLLYQETAGNYLYAHEIISELAEAGNIGWEGDRLILEDGWQTNMAVPEGVRAIVGRRIMRLAARHKTFLSFAAVLGRSFVPEEIDSVSGIDISSDGILNELVNNGFIAQVEFGGKARFDFSHGQLRRAVYDELPEDIRQDYHLRIANYFETRGARAEFLGRHFLAAGEFEKAFGFLYDSAQQAEDVFAFGKAVEFYRSALRCAEAEDLVTTRQQRIFSSCLGLGKALDFLSPVEAKEPLAQAVEFAEKISASPEALAEAAISAGNNFVHIGENEMAAGSFERGLAAAVGSDHKKFMGMALTGLGFVYDKMGRLDEAERAYFGALDALSETDFPEGSCRVLNYMGIIKKRQGDLGGALEFYRRALDISIQRKFLWSAMNLYGNLGNLYLAQGVYDKGLEYYSKSLQISQEISDRRIESINLLNIGHTYNEMGNLEQAEKRFFEAIRKFRELGDKGSEAITLNNLGLLYYRKGELYNSVKHYRDGLEVALNINQPRAALANKIGLAEDFLAIGNFDKAEAEIEEARVIARSINDIEQLAVVYVMAADLKFEQGDLNGATVEISEYFSLSDQIGEPLQKARAILIGEACGLPNMPLQTLRELSEKNAKIGLVETRFRATAALAKTANAEIWVVRLGQGIQKSREYLMPTENWRLSALKIRYLKNLGEEQEVVRERERLREELSLALAGFDSTVLERLLAYLQITSENIENEDFIMSRVSREERLEVLIRVARTINTIRELDPLLNKIMDLALETLEGERGFIMLFSSLEKNSERVLEPKAARNLAQEDILGETTISHSSALEVATTGKPLILGRANGNLDARQSVADFRISSILCAPLAVKGETLGIVYVDSRTGTTFSKDDLDFLVNFADLAAIAIENASLAERLSKKNIYLQKQVEFIWGFGNIVGRSPAMQKVFRMSESVAETDVTVVLTGESGTGKELLAKAIHFASPRKNNRFVPVDCGAMTETLLESELFGYIKGAFTGAISDREGLFEVAEGGTIFLDEISNTSKNFQAKLLRVLQENEIRRVGDNKLRKLNVRIIAATNKDLELEVKSGSFREDLFYRLNVVNIALPGLRDRPEDIPLLANYFLEKICGKMKIASKSFSAEARDVLFMYSWPGNVRQLENICERVAIFSKDNLIGFDDMPAELRSLKAVGGKSNQTSIVPQTKSELKSEKNKMEKLFIMNLLKSTSGNVMEASRFSGMDRSQIHHLMSRFGINSADFKKPGNQD